KGARQARFQAGESVIEVEVADTGPGIRPQDREKIFELFYTTKAVGEGTGLGLSVTRNIINLHHGSIDIDNRPEGGTSVILLFRKTNRENTQ
ncbi:ATP-binding protein, partial [Thiolapillus sp.]